MWVWACVLSKIRFAHRSLSRFSLSKCDTYFAYNTTIAAKREKEREECVCATVSLADSVSVDEWTVNESYWILCSFKLIWAVYVFVLCIVHIFGELTGLLFLKMTIRFCTRIRSRFFVICIPKQFSPLQSSPFNQMAVNLFIWNARAAWFRFGSIRLQFDS